MPSMLPRWVLGLALLCAPCLTRSAEPTNIDQLKQTLWSYHASGYNADVASVAKDALQWLQERTRTAKPGEKLTAVFDVDETLVSTWSYIVATDFAYNETTCNAYIREVPLPAIDPVRQVFLAARRLGVDVVVLTGRRESMRACTIANLRQIGCGDFTRLICRPETSSGSILAFKSEQRRALTAQGQTVILTIGDQRSDLDGGYAERLFKLPNPFYYIP